ncbi:Uncharacterised protein [BD1-7 clade bacterium]|uniref:DUF1722 domain-containing protein n=1 Tax=BD1-7 clade bacterium TaxID=2029982 RepID=A0A5S9PII6_9GAMM|nr:Uncharacterised protein [BD1-7 clade bacterium]CAA0103996.1 Uncharacterised protein [BD1-7 clade bacterium]
MSESEKPRIGISSCLLGERVRFDGGHKQHSYIDRTLGQFFDFTPFCPEVEIGLGIPRQPIRLIVTDVEDQWRCVGTKDPTLDVTEKLQSTAEEQGQWIQALSGYIVKKDSPSCGMERVKVYNDKMPGKQGIGLYTQRIMKNFPLLPVEEEGRMGDPGLRENFIQRVYLYHEWRGMCETGLKAADLIDFHSRYKFSVLSHSQPVYRELGKLVAGVTKDTVDGVSAKYIEMLMPAMKKVATRANHVNVLQHIQGYLKNQLDKGDKQELVELIGLYHRGEVPLIVPVTLLNHLFRKHPHDYIEQSTYMQPYPAEMRLLNTI